MKKYVKVFCKKSGGNGLVTIEQENGSDVITNFYELSDETAKNIETESVDDLPVVSGHLKPCYSCGGRRPRCCDKSRQCSVEKKALWYQCLYCSKLEIVRSGGSADFYFIMDESGSMTSSAREEAGKAVEKLIETLVGAGNTYTFVAFASFAKKIFSHEKDISAMRPAIKGYVNDEYSVGASTAAHLAFAEIERDVLGSDRSVRIIFLTDGYFDDESAAIERRDRLLQGKDVEILAIGITGANLDTIRKISTVEQFSDKILDARDLSSTFEQIAEKLKQSGNNF